uniref:Bulb-type lectin domain-containing protein n=1 Tax=Opuntia streptacantha TaxID=393608 RepID=A0A7C9AG60_OPUST
MSSKMFPSPWFITVVIPFSISISISLLCFLPVIEATPDTLTANDSLSINQTLISAEGKFELGFFSPANSNKYYVGIWYKDIPASDSIVWVANRDAPSSTDSCTLQLRSDGNLFILENGSNILWSTNLSQVENPALQLLDSGNLVIREADDENSDHYIWQSFDYPTDTLLPGQKLGRNLKTRGTQFIASSSHLESPRINI